MDWSKRNYSRREERSMMRERRPIDGRLVTRRKPDDIPAFNREMIRMFGQELSRCGSEEQHERKATVTTCAPVRSTPEPDFCACALAEGGCTCTGSRKAGPAGGSYFRYHLSLAILPSSSRDYRDLHRARKQAQNQTGRTAKTLSGLEHAELSLISAGKS